MDLAKLSPNALKAAMQGGTAGWGQMASALDNVRYMERLPKGMRRGRRKCRCGCGKMATHSGKANGITLTQGCELKMTRWVKFGYQDEARKATAKFFTDYQ